MATSLRLRGIRQPPLRQAGLPSLPPPCASSPGVMAFSLRSPVGAGAAEAAGFLGPAASRQQLRCPGGARHAPAPQRLCVLTRASGQPRKGVQAASAAPSAASQQRSSSSTEPSPGPPPAGAQSLQAAPAVSGGRPLLNGGNVVEEEALASALATVQLHASGQLGSRRLRFDCSNVLDSSYARCGEVTEDYGRTFYMGACPASPRAAGHLRLWAPQKPKAPRAARPTRTPPHSPPSRTPQPHS